MIKEKYAVEVRLKGRIASVQLSMLAGYFQKDNFEVRLPTLNDSFFGSPSVTLLKEIYGLEESLSQLVENVSVWINAMGFEASVVGYNVTEVIKDKGE